MKNKVVIVFIFLSSIIYAQNDDELSPLEFSGYIKDVQTVFVPHGMEQNWLSDNALHNRLKLNYYPAQWLTIDMQVRNRFIYGDFVKYFPDYAKYAQPANYFVNLDYVWLNDSSVVGLSEIDRLNVQVTFGDWELTVGRQRINWGMNLIWNPNDIFNTFSYFDFEYEERPGTDALRLRYYTSLTGSAEIVYKAGDQIDEMAFAGLYRFNAWSYDFQLLAGFMGDDYVFGTGYTGNIEGAAFRGEFSYFKPRQVFYDTKQKDGVFIGSISGDYTFSSTLYIHGGVLFNSSGARAKAGQLQLIGNQDLSPKTLSRGRINLFGQTSYAITPLITATISSIMNPDDLSVFVNPVLSASLSDSFEMLLAGQLFFGEKNTEFGKIGQIASLRFKFNF